MTNFLTAVVLQRMRDSAANPRRQDLLASPSDKRVSYAVQLWLTASEGRRLELEVGASRVVLVGLRVQPLNCPVREPSR